MRLSDIYKLMCEDKAEWLVKQGIPENIVKFAMDIDKKHAVWIATQLHKLGQKGTHIPRQDIEYILDWVKATTPNLSQYSYDQAKEASDEWHKDFEESEDSENLKYKSNHVIYTFGNEHAGWRIVRLDPEDCEIEGEKMGHCVGQYKEKVKEESSWIFSLRDPKNEPHVTIEFRTSLHEHKNGKKDMDLIQVQGKSNKEPIDEYKKMIEEWIEEFKKAYEDEYDFTVGDEGSYNLSDLFENNGPKKFYGFWIKSSMIGGSVIQYVENLKEIADLTNEFEYTSRAIRYFKDLAQYAKIFNELSELEEARNEVENDFLVNETAFLATEHPDRPRRKDFDSEEAFDKARDAFEQEELSNREYNKFFQQAYEMIEELKKA